MHFSLDTQVLGQKREDVIRHDGLGIAIPWPRRESRAPVIGNDDAVAVRGKRGDYVPELVGGLREAVQEDDGGFWGGGDGGGWAVEVVEAEFFGLRAEEGVAGLVGG